MRALFGFDPDRAAERTWRSEFERGLCFWGATTSLQMLRGPGSPFARMLTCARRLDGVIFGEIARRRRGGERGEDILEPADRRGRTRTAALHRLRRSATRCMTLLFAGHDTTTSTVTFLFYELARNPRARPATASGSS